ncbi:MAG: homoserine O-succinyltransferase [Chitinivibrionales bacterium]|nr:homoserine O-succinyltransferase [Chitinivibrionales bacterium]MBD3396928.1 homoserine O-succinyltransferase [Chitinivibrionales bacterium]
MTVVLPRDYHARDALKRREIPWKTHEDALREDIRALRIGILNIMPQAQTYEFNLLQPLGYSVIQIEPIWIRLTTHAYQSTSRDHLDNLYVSFKDSIEQAHLDGLIITGAPVEEIPFEEISYWQEVLRILKYARNNVASTLGLCWAGIAIAKFLGLESERYEKKLFGVYPTRNLDPNHPVMSGMDDVFWCPQSRHSGISDAEIERGRDSGIINPLAFAEGAGYTIFETTDRRFLVHLGHPEYHSRRIREEYERDISRGREDVAPPLNFNLDSPVNRWRSHRYEFYAEWIKYVHETTSY